MASNVFNEQGEQTHVLLDMEEYRRMSGAVEHLASIRQFAQGMLDQVGGDIASPVTSSSTPDSNGHEEHSGEEYQNRGY